jgi:hypothetical protein
MRGSIVTSAVLHCLVLAAALVTLSAPKSFDVQEVDALPVDIVPVESITQMQQGDKKAPMKEKSATKPTTKQTQVANAENVGENDVDLKSPPTPTVKPTEVQAAAPPKTQAPQPKVDPTPNDVKSIEKEETAPPPPKEVAAIPQQKPDLTPPTPTPPPPTPTPPTPPTPTPPPPTPTPPQQSTEQQPSDEAAPDSVPVPAVKPQPPTPPTPPKQADKQPDKPQDQKPAEKPADKKPDQAQAQTADKSDKDKKKDDKKRDVAKAAASQNSDFNANEISALLNKQQASGGGAKRSHEEASLGGKTNTGGAKLTQSEMDAIKGQIEGNWSNVAGLQGASDVRIQVKVSLDQSGNIVGDPEVTATGGPEGTRQAFQSSALRAVLRSAPLKNLPADKYDGANGWNQLILNFDPSDLSL